MILNNGIVLCDDFKFRRCDIKFEEKIRSLGKLETGVDVTGLYVIPGFFDIHTHGVAGQDMMTANDIESYKDYMFKNGILNFFVTTVTSDIKDINSALNFWGKQDFIRGINLEGPFISAEKKGAHPQEFIIESDMSLLYDLIEKSNNKIKITTIAPDVGSNLEYIPKISELGIKVSLGHTNCDYETANIAFRNGATHTTHLFNAMSGLNHRQSGLVGAALDNDDVYCEIISDGIHLAPEIVRLTYKIKGSDRMILISDSMAATGLNDGEYMLGGDKITVLDGVARTIDGALAGSTKNLRQMVKTAISFGIPMEDAIKMASLTPAKAVDMDNEIGSLKKGKIADILVVDKDLSINMAFKNGSRIM